jgi:hypothetical protein
MSQAPHCLDPRRTAGERDLQTKAEILTKTHPNRLQKEPDSIALIPEGQRGRDLQTKAEISYKDSSESFAE